MPLKAIGIGCNNSSSHNGTEPLGVNRNRTPWRLSEPNDHPLAGFMYVLGSRRTFSVRLSRTGFAPSWRLRWKGHSCSGPHCAKKAGTHVPRDFRGCLSDNCVCANWAQASRSITRSQCGDLFSFSGWALDDHSIGALHNGNPKFQKLRNSIRSTIPP